MGACEFWAKGHGKSAAKAFDYAVANARYVYGNGGYTGTIAEKDSYRMVQVPEGRDPKDYAMEMLDDEKSWVQDKWGPAGCIQLGKSEYLFFGWASE